MIFFSYMSQGPINISALSIYVFHMMFIEIKKNYQNSAKKHHMLPFKTRQDSYKKKEDKVETQLCPIYFHVFM